MSEKISKFFIRIMLLIYIGLLGLGVFLGTFGKLESPSYILAFALALAMLALIWVFRQRLGRLLGRIRLPGPFLTGLVLSLFCLLLNLAWVLYFQIEPTVDFQTFNDTALAIARNERVDMLYIGLFPHILGYSTFLGLMMRLLGESAMLAPVLNVVLTLISGLCIYILCLRWLELKAAAAAFFLWSICPSKLMYNAMVMSEPLYTCLILLFLLLLSLALDRKLHRRLRLLAAIPLGLACGALLLAVNATRPVAVILFVAFFIWALLLRGRQLKELKGWLALAAFTLSMFGAYSYCDRQWFRWEYLHIFERTSDIPRLQHLCGTEYGQPGQLLRGGHGHPDELPLPGRSGLCPGADAGVGQRAPQQRGDRLSQAFCRKAGKAHGQRRGRSFLCPGGTEPPGVQAVFRREQCFLLFRGAAESVWSPEAF